MKSTIRLFKALPIKEVKSKETTTTLLLKTIPRGFIFSPEVIHNYSNYDELIKLVEEEVGLTKEQMNNAFHKSWTKIKDASDEQLIIEQLVHYFTTYGAEAQGCYNEEYVFVPKEKLNIPELEEGIKLVIIKGLTKEQIKVKLLELLSTGIALKDETLKDVIDVAWFVGINEDDIELIKNKEAKIILYDNLNMLPENPVEFLRFIIFKCTEKTLLIKNPALIKEIKETENLGIIKYFKAYEDKYTLNPLAQVFNRFKPLFLAYKTNPQLRTYMNRIRKLSVKHHKPMQEDLLNEITAKIKKGETIDISLLKKKLGEANTFRKVRLAYALKYRMSDTESILYKVRNGKGYAKEQLYSDSKEYKKIYDFVMYSLVEDIAKNVKGKKIFIPDYITYALPATEKQFTGDFPSGTCVKVKEDMVAGIHWTNLDNRRVDLDLSLISLEHGKIGWDSSFRTNTRNVMFTGDLVDAPKPNGASELFYLKGDTQETQLMMLNYFNYSSEHPVPFKIIVANEKVKDFDKHYIVNPNNVKTVCKTKIDVKEKIIGLLISDKEGCKFYFSEVGMGNVRNSSGKDYVKHSRNYLRDFYTNTINLNEVLVEAGAVIVEDKEECDIDLSPESLEKGTIIKLIS